MLRLATLIAAAAALVLSAAASAKLTSVTVMTPAAAPRAHVPWTLTVHVSLRGKPYAKRGYRPRLYLVDKAGIPIATFHGSAFRPGMFHVGITFPRAGKWRYVIPDPLNGDWWFLAPRVGA